jgi:tRNA(Ile)-lysidine synthase
MGGTSSTSASIETRERHPFESRLVEAWPPERWSDFRLVVAVSGGADSVALLRAMCALQPQRRQLSAAHFNHGLRGEESDGDAQFVRRLCSDMGVACDIQRADPIEMRQHQTGDGLESSCRHVRYDYLVRHARQMGARYILTAHTADDQVETVLHNIIRGTGFAGLAGIPAVRPISEAVSLVRPLLTFDRESIVAYLRDLGQGYRHDSSNSERDFTRNRIRHELLPLLEREFNPRVRQSLRQLARLAADVKHDVTDRLAEFDPALEIVSADCVLVHRAKFRWASPFLAAEFLIRLWNSQSWPLQAMDYDRWRTVAAMLGDDESHPAPPAIDLPGGIRARRERDLLRIERIAG